MKPPDISKAIGQNEMHDPCPPHPAPLKLLPMPTAAPSPQILPDATGHFGPYGGVFVPETLVNALHQLEAEYASAKNDPAFVREFESYLRDFVGRPSRLYFAERLTQKLGGAKIYLKREDLNHTG